MLAVIGLDTDLDMGQRWCDGDRLGGGEKKGWGLGSKGKEEDMG